MSQPYKKADGWWFPDGRGPYSSREKARKANNKSDVTYRLRQRIDKLNDEIDRLCRLRDERVVILMTKNEKLRMLLNHTLHRLAIAEGKPATFYFLKGTGRTRMARK